MEGYGLVFVLSCGTQYSIAEGCAIDQAYEDWCGEARNGMYTRH